MRATFRQPRKLRRGGPFVSVPRAGKVVEVKHQRLERAQSASMSLTVDTPTEPQNCSDHRGGSGVPWVR